MKKIAHFGAFDHESYGDVLFPKMLEHLLPDFSITHVAPTNIVTQWTDACPIISTAEAIQRTDWDGIIVGGGDIIHTGVWSTEKWEQNAALPFGHLPGLWAGAAFLSAKLNIPIVWNAPGVPLPFDPWFAETAKLALACTDYITVRDAPSKQLLTPFTDKPITIIPDSALILNRVWETPPTDDTIVFAVSKKDTALYATEINTVIRKLKTASAAGTRKVVVAPLMNWQFENESQEEWLLRHAIDASFAETCTSLEATAKLIGCSSGYIGHSLHGLITAIACGVPAVLITPTISNKAHKYKGFFDTIELDAACYTAATWKEAGEKLLQQKPAAVRTETIAAFDRHIETIRTILLAGRIDKTDYWDQLSEKFKQEGEKLYLLGSSPEQIACFNEKNKQHIKHLKREIQTLKAEKQAAASLAAQGRSILRTIFRMIKSAPAAIYQRFKRNA